MEETPEPRAPRKGKALCIAAIAFPLGILTYLWSMLEKHSMANPHAPRILWWSILAGAGSATTAVYMIIAQNRPKRWFLLFLGWLAFTIACLSIALVQAYRLG